MSIVQQHRQTIAEERLQDKEGTVALGRQVCSTQNEHTKKKNIFTYKKDRKKKLKRCKQQQKHKIQKIDMFNIES